MIERAFSVAFVAMTLFASSLLADDSNTPETEKTPDGKTVLAPKLFRSFSANTLDSLVWFSSTQKSSLLGAEAAGTPRIPVIALEPPTGLSAEVYSSSALELFWDRVTDTTLSYEVRQDTRSIGFTDGTSFFISSGVEPGVEYVFEVIARFDNQPGVQISESAKITVSLSNDNPNPTKPAPAAPDNVSIAIYSSSAAELFWDRALASERIVSTEVFRDGILLGSTDGTSFMDWSRSEGQAYVYSLVAINADGERSIESVLVDGDQPPVEPAPEIVVNESNLEEILGAIGFLTRGEPAQDELLIAEGLIFGDYDELLQFQPTSEPPTSFRVSVENFSCEQTDQGEAGSLVRTTIDRLDSASIEVEVNNCSILGASLSGNIVAETGSLYVLSVSDLISSTLNAGTTTLSATYTDTNNSETGTRVLDVMYEEVDGDELTEFDYSIVETNLGLDVTWSIAVEPEGSAVSANSSIGFARDSPETEFTVGTLDVDLQPGLSIMIDADNGDLGSFSIIVEDGDVSTSYTANWTDDNRYYLYFNAN